MGSNPIARSGHEAHYGALFDSPTSTKSQNVSQA
jgi:hypothetical protein